MNYIPKSHTAGLASELEAKHYLALQTGQRWQDVLELFYQNEWFCRKLGFAARCVVRRCRLDVNCVDDVKQQALVEFARSLERNPGLGFDSERGSFGAFLSTVIQRCCQKGLRQFQLHRSLSIDNEYLHPSYNDSPQIDNALDFQQLACQIPEPYRGTIQQICEGMSVDEIALERKRSKRTIYRWIDKATTLLQSKFLEPVDV